MKHRYDPEIYERNPQLLDDWRGDVERMNLGSQGKYQPGESNGNTRLTEDDVREIRRIWHEHIGSHRGLGKELAYRYKVGVPTISNIVHYRTWKHVVANP